MEEMACGREIPLISWAVDERKLIDTSWRNRMLSSFATTTGLAGTEKIPVAAKIADAILQLGSRVESFHLERKAFGLFLGPFIRALFHQGLERFLFALFLRVHPFTHMRRSS
jgi:hypothetical protein